MVLPMSGLAHEVRPAIADLNVQSNKVEISVRLTLESLIAGINLAAIDDTDDAPEAADYDRLRALPPEALISAFYDDWPRIQSGIRVHVDANRMMVRLVDVVVEQTTDLSLPRDSIVRLEAALPIGDSPVTFAWDAAYGPIIVRQIDAGEDAYTDYLTDGGQTAPLPRMGLVTETIGAIVLRYVVIGFDHIIPKGLDHILFVLGLFLLSTRLRPLIIQVTAFTLAHTVTLGLAVFGWIAVPANLVEPLIAASIVYVAIENVKRQNITTTRTLIVFIFGLLHGLGFASVLGDVGLSPGHLVSGLIGFNIGVELGQLSVIATAWALIATPFRRQPWYRARVVIPMSLIIAAIGAFWFVERVVG